MTEFKRNLLKRKPSVVTSVMLGHSIYNPSLDLFLHYDAEENEWKWVAAPETVVFASKMYDLINNTASWARKEYHIEDVVRTFLSSSRIKKLQLKGCQLVPSDMYIHLVNEDQIDIFLECDFLNACGLLDLRFK